MRPADSRSGHGCRHIVALVAMAGSAAGLSGAGCSVGNGLVGGVCADGFADCQDECIPVMADPSNCGACGHVCASGSCVAGTCAELIDGSTDGSADARIDAVHDGASRDARANDGGSRDGPSGDGTEIDGRRDVTDSGHRDGLTPDSRRDTTRPDGIVSDASTQDGSHVDGSGHDAPRADAVQEDAPPHDSSSHDAPVDRNANQCAPPYVTAANCGACGLACVGYQVCAPPPIDAGADAGAYSCVDTCPLPWVDCSATCVDETSDPMNCGACGTVCPLGLCVNSSCAGTTSGEIVVIGHNYATANVNVSEAQILSNAVFLPPVNPLVVLSFEQYANSAQVTTVKSVLKTAAQAYGRTVSLVAVTDYAAVPDALTTKSYAVLLIYDQADAPSGQLATVGGVWAPSISDFLSEGGEVVVLDGAAGVDEMPRLLSTSGLLQTTSDVPVASGKALFVVAPNDAVGNFVTSPYPAQTNTAYFVTSEANGGNVTYVVDRFIDVGPVPVVIHKIAGP